MSDRDPTDRASADESLLQFLYQAPIGLVRFAPDGTVDLMNPTAAALLMPIAPRADLGDLFVAMSDVFPGLRALVAERGLHPGDVVCDGLRIGLPDGRTVSLQVQRLDTRSLVASIVDATHEIARERDRVAAEVRDAVRTDALTGLPVREAFRDAVRAALEAAADGCGPVVLHVGLDRFSRLNVLFGRETGDSVLREVADRLVRTVRTHSPRGASPTLARLGGDEFAVLLPAVGAPSDATRLATRVVDALARTDASGDGRLPVTVSIGVAAADAGLAAHDAETLLQRASLGLAAAKAEGGHRWRRFDPAMEARARVRGGLEIDLRDALARDELFVVYQPYVRLAAGEADAPEPAGVEALVRWRHPERGIVPPGEFIEVAEHSGLIVPLGRFVLETACRQLAQWRRTLGPDAPSRVSVNLSAGQLGDDAAIVSTVSRVLHDTGLPAHALQLEVTETMAAQDPKARARLAELRALGVRLALDDFGTGYSSLSSLHELPVDVVKVDRSFVTRLEDSAHHRALVEATVLVARSLGLQTLAEGIETPGQAEALVALGCDKGQGYLYARPLPADELVGWLRRSAEARTGLAHAREQCAANAAAGSSYPGAAKETL